MQVIVLLMEPQSSGLRLLSFNLGMISVRNVEYCHGIHLGFEKTPFFGAKFEFIYLLHTILKVKFLSKNSILTKKQHFHEFFTQFFFDNFSREIKVVNS